jgi:hypothetical protein
MYNIYNFNDIDFQNVINFYRALKCFHSFLLPADTWEKLQSRTIVSDEKCSLGERNTLSWSTYSESFSEIALSRLRIF